MTTLVPLALLTLVRAETKERSPVWTCLSLA
jgi:hypothetical protein